MTNRRKHRLLKDAALSLSSGVISSGKVEWVRTGSGSKLYLPVSSRLRLLAVALSVPLSAVLLLVDAVGFAKVSAVLSLAGEILKFFPVGD